jgi:acyl carrier protein
MEYVGRTDFQLKIRGFRIEPGEIEAALLAHPDVRSATVVAAGEDGEKRLVAYAVPVEGAAPAPAELVAWLAGRLPEYMVPSAAVVLDAWPLTPNGKLDRDALPVPGVDADNWIAPATETEAAVAAVWEELLERPRVGAGDDFFLLGGHSLLATRIMSRLRALFGVEIPLRALFETPTVAGLSRAVDAAVLAAAGEDEIAAALRELEAMSDAQVLERLGGD